MQVKSFYVAKLRNVAFSMNAKCRIIGIISSLLDAKGTGYETTIVMKALKC